jgi:hypothetical protein
MGSLRHAALRGPGIEARPGLVGAAAGGRSRSPREYRHGYWFRLICWLAGGASGGTLRHRRDGDTQIWLDRAFARRDTALGVEPSKRAVVKGYSDTHIYEAGSAVTAAVRGRADAWIAAHARGRCRKGGVAETIKTMRASQRRTPG